MSLVDFISTISVLVIIFLHLFFILRRISSIESFISSSPKFVYEVKIENSPDGIRTINSEGLSFPQYYRSEKVSSMQDIFPNEPTIVNYHNNDLHKFFEHKKGNSYEIINHINHLDNKIIPIFKRVQDVIEKKGVFKERKLLLDCIFDNSDGIELNLKDIAYIFVILKNLNLLHLSNYDKKHSFSLNSFPFMRRLGSYMYWYYNHSNKIDHVSKSTWKLRNN